MALSLKHFLLLVLFAGFALAALTHSERAYMLEIVKFVTFGTLVVMAYGTWAYAGQRRAYRAGFVLWGGAYYVLYVIIQSRPIDLGTDRLVNWLFWKLEPGRGIWAVFEKTSHLLFSLAFGIIGGWVTVYFYRRRRALRRNNARPVSSTANVENHEPYQSPS
jgi:hypothetical protein